MRIYNKEQVELVRVQFFDVVNHIPKSKRVPSIALEDSHFTCKYNHKLVCEYVHNCFIQYMVKPINCKKSVRTMMSIKREEFGKNPGKKGVNRKGLSRQITVYNLSCQQCHDMFMKYLNKIL